MTDYVTISKAEIEALPRCADIHGRESVIKVDDLRALLDKAPSVEPVGYVVSTKPELLWGGNTSSIIFREYDGHLRPLYTSPPQAETRIAELEKDAMRYRKLKASCLSFTTLGANNYSFDDLSVDFAIEKEIMRSFDEAMEKTNEWKRLQPKRSV